MEVRLFPNARRPGVGQKPRRENSRPLLPQHARHCPVLEAGSSLGFLVYPPLEEREAFKVAYEGDGRYQFVYYVNPAGRRWEGVFSVAISLPLGGIGMFEEEVTHLTRVETIPREHALLMMRTFIVPEDLGTPAGALTLRGAWNFQTPPGWDTVYTPIFNMIERPVAPMLVIRVETDWYAHETEFRYVLQPGEAISAAHTMPIGQAVFVPREEPALRECTDAEIAVIRKSQEEFWHEKAAAAQTTPYGLTFSPHYLRKSRSQTAVPHVETAPPRTPSIAIESTDMDEIRAVEDPDAPKVGRNDPCPCGSGKKYKKCHGA
jgi:uncharacterized protein YchJ